MGEVVGLMNGQIIKLKKLEAIEKRLMAEQEELERENEELKRENEELRELKRENEELRELKRENEERKEVIPLGIIKREDVIAWQDGNKIVCLDCGDPGEAEPLTKKDFDDGDIVTCDSCPEHRRIL